MFTTKQKELISKPKVEVAPAKEEKKKKNAFIEGSKKRAATTTALGNHAVKLTTTDNDFVDQFAKATIYKSPRTYAEIDKDMRLLWSQDPEKTVKLSLYLRMITRVVQVAGMNTEETQRGQGLKHEGIVRMIWLEVNHPATFYKNLPLLVAVGGWKDIFQMLSFDIQYNGWKEKKLDWFEIGHYVLAGLEDPTQSELIKKYLPRISSDKECNTLEAQARNIIGKYICSLMFDSKNIHKTFDPTSKVSDGWNYKRYRKLKAEGTAHEWQQLISQKRLADLNFDKVHGRALSKLVSSKFLKNNKLTEKYAAWIASKPVAKYTGFVYELFLPVGQGKNMISSHVESHVIDTINKQFLGLVETAKNGMKEGDAKLIAVIDTSASMSSLVQGTQATAHTVAKCMALYFSYLLEGTFADHYLEFSDETIMRTWKGKTPVDKICADNSSITRGTNFQSVGEHFVKILRSGVPEADFPTGIICISDGCFNPVNFKAANQTNFHALKSALSSGGFSKKYVDNFKVILWDVPNSYYSKKGHQAFEDFADCPGLFHIGGLDGAAIAFITGTINQTKVVSNSEELFEAAMDQEVLNLVEV